MASRSSSTFPLAHWLAPVALLLAILIGGGGSPAPVPEIILQSATAFLFGLWIWMLPGRIADTVPGPALLCAAIFLAVPLLQLIPLPPAVWHALPGRAAAREALALIGQQDRWQTISLDPARTLASFLAMASASAILVMTAAMPAVQRWRIVAVLAAGGILTVLLGAAQLSSSPGSPLYFYGSTAPLLAGFQANRNSTADVLLIAAIAIFALIRHLARSGRSPWSGGVILASGTAALLVMGLAVALTESRTGVVLLVVLAIGFGVFFRPWLRISPKVAMSSLLAAAGLIAVLHANPALNRVVQRFDAGSDLRREIWQDSVYVAQSNAPVGVGMGNFYPSYIAAERLESIGQTVPNRAHNDYLELAVEAGVPGALALVLCLAILLKSARSGLAAPRDDARQLARFAVLALIVIALHSVVDYPLRSMSLAAIAAACAGLVIPAKPDRTANNGSNHHESAA